MAAVIKQRQPPPGYPTGEDAKEEQAPQVVDDSTEKAQQNGEDDDETDRGISAGFIIGRSKPGLQERRYPGPVLYSSSKDHGHHGYQPHPPGGGAVYEVGYGPQQYYPQQYYRQPGPNYYRDGGYGPY